MHFFARTSAVVCLLVTLTSQLLISCGPKAVEEDFELSTRAVQQFHSALDAGRFPEIYDGSAPDLKSRTSETDFVQLLSAIHRKLGATILERQVGFSERWSFRRGFLVHLDYDTRFERGVARERFTWRPNNSGALLVGYQIDSQALIVR